MADLRFSEDDNFKNTEPTTYHGALAITKPPLSSNLIDIKFNTDTNLESNILSKPDVVQAVAIVHEMLHAEMYRKMLDAVKAAEINHENLNWTTWTYPEFVEFVESLENKYFGVFDFYSRFEWDTTTPSDAQHQLMANRYRNVIKEVLDDNFPSLSEGQKEALSWIGLDRADIVAWQLLTQEERDNINVIQRHILNGFSNECN